MIYAGKKSLKHIAISVAVLSLYAGHATIAHAAPTKVSPLFSNTIADKELDQDRGTGFPAISNEAISTINGSVTGGTDTNTVSGMNVISSGALAGAGGLTTVIQNSGNNVGIQSATTVNVTFVNALGASPM